MQLMFLRLAVLPSAAARALRRRKPGSDRPRTARPPMRKKERRVIPVQSLVRPLSRSSMALVPRKAGCRKAGSRRTGAVLITLAKTSGRVKGKAVLFALEPTKRRLLTARGRIIPFVDGALGRHNRLEPVPEVAAASRAAAAVSVAPCGHGNYRCRSARGSYFAHR